MTNNQKLSDGSDKKPQGNSGIKENNCRCKEVSKKSFLEMLKLMLRDLAFRKKAK